MRRLKRSRCRASVVRTPVKRQRSDLSEPSPAPRSRSPRYPTPQNFNGWTEFPELQRQTKVHRQLIRWVLPRLLTSQAVTRSKRPTHPSDFYTSRVLFSLRTTVRVALSHPIFCPIFLSNFFAQVFCPNFLWHIHGLRQSFLPNFFAQFFCQCFLPNSFAQFFAQFFTQFSCPILLPRPSRSPWQPNSPRPPPN